ncbi:hypothetical protein ABL78_1969 [Leptomonas seymouri]|uniref:Uncharacterized protein n=1 Tax=Leptomonas seymouri TaxID=5684 RepID=A0A0N1ILW0_LEPSE|nr:hypothetical protein ABL78_1969 [Leptomonas seymouri]|eukprot:KPI88924.1 hypothetical protein ABL78_1969 [Leptomonas seymouri]
MKSRQNHESTSEVAVPFSDDEPKKARPLVDIVGNQPIVVSPRCIMQHAAVISVVILMAVLIGLGLWHLQNDSSYDQAKLDHARPPW